MKFFHFYLHQNIEFKSFQLFFFFSKISSIRLWLNAYRRHRLKTNLSTFAGTMDVDVASFRFLQSLRPKIEIPWPSKQTNISCTLVISERKLCNPQNVFFLNSETRLPVVAFFSPPCVFVKGQHVHEQLPLEYTSENPQFRRGQFASCQAKQVRKAPRRFFLFVGGWVEAGNFGPGDVGNLIYLYI